jgi:hypothetical protein
MTDTEASIKSLWSNGNRKLFLAVMYGITALLLLIAATVFALCRGESEKKPLTWQPLPLAVNNRLAGVSGPALRAGDTLVIFRERCNTTGDTILVETSHFLRRQDVQTALVPSEHPFVVAEIPSGCVSGIIEEPIPDDLPVGDWTFEFAVDWHIGDKSGLVLTSTEQFRVVP